jgi:DNA helicase-2/ATP-dependent DNA helicase PcrA
VGDPNQAIYGWRGASVSNILEFGRSFPRPTAPATYPLTVNRRSDERILATANHLAEPLYDERPSCCPLEPKPEAGPGGARRRARDLDAELDALGDQVLGLPRRPARRGRRSAC